MRTPLLPWALILMLSIAATPAAEGRRLRGFTTQEISIPHLEDMHRAWNANSVRLMLRPNFVARQAKLATYREAWQRILAELPAYLDRARELDMAVVLDLHEVPSEAWKTYGSDRRKALSQFWKDRGNLDLIKACWRDIGVLCADRKQDIWYDILNEPLSWDDFPKVPAEWPGWAQEIIDDIRSRDAHPVVVEVGPGGLCWGFADFPLLRGANIIYSTHQYQPHGYTHQGISEIGNTDLARKYLETNQPWPGTYSDTGGGRWDKQRLYIEMQAMIDFQKKHNVRIYISETGVVRWAPDAARYVRDNLEIFEEFGWDWSFHALHENPMWSPAYEPTFGKENIRAEKTTAIGAVVLEYLGKNR